MSVSQGNQYSNWASGPFSALGADPLVNPVIRFGDLTNIQSVDTPLDIWNVGGTYTGFPLGSAEPVEVFSSDANDTLLGTGARVVQIRGLDENFNEQTENLLMNGVAPVSTTTLWSRINVFFVGSGGSNGANIGSVTVRHTSTTSNIFGVIDPGVNIALAAVYTVPANRILVLTQTDVSISRANAAAGSAKYSFQVRGEGGVFVQLALADFTTQNSAAKRYNTGIQLMGKADMKFTLNSASSNGTNVSAFMEGVQFG